MSADVSTPVQNTPVLLPKIGQAMTEGVVIQWHRQDGDHAEQGETLVTIETDKATYDLEAPASGILHIYINEGQEVAIGTLIGEIGDAPRRPSAPVAPVLSSAPPTTATHTAARKRVLASPKAKQLAAEHGLDLSTITPSSPDGVISAGDVEHVIVSGKPTISAVTETGGGRPIRERRRLMGIRKTAARRIQEAWQTIPHIVQMVDVNATALLATRAALKAEVPSLTLNDLILSAAARSMTDQPDLNGTIEGDTLMLYEGVDVGFAVDTPRGLVVPVIRSADTLSVGELAAESQRLIDAARSGRLEPAHIGGASLTVSNLGMFGIRAGTPVINLGEPVLIFVGTVDDRPVVREGQVVIQPTLTLSLAYDHRVADGVAAARFTRGLKEKLEFGVHSLESRISEPAPLPPTPQAALGKREVRSISEGSGYVVQVRSRGHAWVLDEPTTEGGTDTGPDPVTVFLGAVLSCLTIAFKATARRRKVTIERIEGHVQATPAGQVKNIDLTLAVWSPAPEEQVRVLLETAKRSCYVSGVLKPELDFKVGLTIHSPEQE